jgi:hypothetical protein
MHLTYRDSNEHTSVVSTANAGEAGAPEREWSELGSATKRVISPAMLEAGLVAWGAHDHRMEGAERAVARIFLAMCRKQRRQLQRRY